MADKQPGVKNPETKNSQNLNPKRPSKDDMRTSTDHIRVLHGHPNAKGRPSIAKGGFTKWDERVIPFSDLPKYAEKLEGQKDIYLSQNRFYGTRRRIVSLAEITGLWADLDFHRTQSWKDSRPEDVAYAVLRRIGDEGLPLPSYILFTGRGLLIAWMLDKPLAREALPRWQAAERYIIQELNGFGADMKATDAARVFRLIGTANSRSGEAVRALWNSGRLWDFEELCELVLPFTREQVAKFRKQAASNALLTVPRAEIDLQEGLLWYRRLLDLQALRKLRFLGPLPEGQRDWWLFLASVALGWMCPSNVLEREILELGREALGGNWTDGQIRGQIGSAIRRAKAAARGETITWQGEKIDPRYRFRTETIIERLEITPEEMRSGKFITLVTPEILSERQAEKGRASGAARRQANSERDAGIIAAYKAGQTQKDISQKTGLNQSTISRILRRATEYA